MKHDACCESWILSGHPKTETQIIVLIALALLHRPTSSSPMNPPAPSIL
jgi:hypothetical protein